MAHARVIVLLLEEPLQYSPCDCLREREERDQLIGLASARRRSPHCRDLHKSPVNTLLLEEQLIGLTQSQIDSHRSGVVAFDSHRGALKRNCEVVELQL